MKIVLVAALLFTSIGCSETSIPQTASPESKDPASPSENYAILRVTQMGQFAYVVVPADDLAAQKAELLRTLNEDYLVLLRGMQQEELAIQSARPGARPSVYPGPPTCSVHRDGIVGKKKAEEMVILSVQLARKIQGEKQRVLKEVVQIRRQAHPSKSDMRSLINRAQEESEKRIEALLTPAQYEAYRKDGVPGPSILNLPIRRSAGGLKPRDEM